MTNINIRFYTQSHLSLDKNDFVTRRHRGHLWQVPSSDLNKETGMVPVVYTFKNLVQTPIAYVWGRKT